MQLSLFESNADDNGQCQYPNVSGLSGFRYGCRCSRCSEAKARWRHPTAKCQHDGCATPRRKHSRWCDEHRPQRAPRIISEAACELCRSSHRWYESILEQNMRTEIRDLYRRTCGGCRKPYISAINKHHLNTTDALRLITARTCELCHERFSIGEDGRRNAVIDHDHRCCSGPNSCGHCVRGVLCHRCNHTIASLEHVVGVGLEQVLAYLARPGGEASVF